jgi:N utilization substance protein A
MSIAREAGDRAKVAVRSNNSDVDPVGTSVGPRGQRVQAIVSELGGENMDIVEWTDDEAAFIANALNPAEVIDVIFDENNERACTVIVPDYQLSLAIGKRGQNARLAAKLTGYKIDIKSESEAEATLGQQAAPAADDATDDVAETVDDETVTDDAPVTDDAEVAADEAASDADVEASADDEAESADLTDEDDSTEA